jgi:hypothetical protein
MSARFANYSSFWCSVNDVGSKWGVGCTPDLFTTRLSVKKMEMTLMTIAAPQTMKCASTKIISSANSITCGGGETVDDKAKENERCLTKKGVQVPCGKVGQWNELSAKNFKIILWNFWTRIFNYKWVKLRHKRSVFWKIGIKKNWIQGRKKPLFSKVI